MPSMSLIVLRTGTIDAMLAFYHALGLVFVQEQHGTGAIHYSTALAGIIGNTADTPAAGRGQTNQPK